ncbi:MAG: leucine-rich repeat protein, partial [bacterium]|nr:leucine-rich repeat protein [bacterium]
MALACVVVFATTYVLILPAITMTNENVCGLEEHTHDASCYTLEWVEAQPEFLCSDETHQHTKECWNEEGEQICGKTELLLHTHDESCFFNGELICPLEELQEHSHTEDCFEEGQRILCGQEEKIHHHTAACYEEAGDATASASDATEAKLTCGYSEGEAEGHVHSNDCYEEWSNLVCEEEEIVAHTHEASCLNEEGELICGLKDTAEHVHSEACMVWPEGMDEDGMVQQEVLSCTLPEHSHTVACKALPEDKLICGLEEHEHDASCYDENKNLICEKTEHRHSMECLDLADWLDGDMEALYVCGKTEHNHTELCYHEVETATPSRARRLLASGSNATSSNSLERADGEPKKELDCGEEEHVHTLACLPPTIMTMALSPYGEFQESGVLETGHTWTVYRNELEEYTLVIEGEGDLPDFTFANDMTQAPWSIYGTNTAGRGYHLVIGDDVTRIGANAFRGQKIFSVDFGSGVESIGELAFRMSRGLGKTEPLKIPGNVKKIEASAFNSSELWAGIELSEGLESIGSNAFSISGNVVWENIQIPSTVKTIDATSFNNAASFTVAEDNPYYSAVDGVLYNKDITKLVAFPRRKVQDTYWTPDTVVEISSGALYAVQGVRKLVIGSSVAKGPQSLTMNSSYEEIIIEDGAGVATTSQFNSSFYGIPNLKSLKLPDNVEFVMHHAFGSQWTYNSLTELYIPNGVTAITNRDDVGTTKMPNLEHLIYNAKNATIEDKNHLGNDTRYELLTIGKDVDYLPKNFYRFVNKATELRFEPDNFFTIEAGAFAGAPVPFDGLSGQIYVDKDGAVYSCKEEEASLIYLPPKLEKYTVLTSITGEDNKTYRVTKIEENAAKYADSLKEITFDTDYVKILGAYALANCPQLKSVNGEQNYEQLLEGLKKEGVALGVNAFYNTGLIGAPKPKDFEKDMDGRKELSVEENGNPDILTIKLSGAENITPQWIKKDEDKDGEIGGYRLLTGETINITASVSSTDAGIHYRYRLYFRVTEDDVNISPMPQNGGDSVLFDGKQEVLYRATDDPYTFYLEWKPYSVGATATIPLIINYPNWTSDGGAVTVWGVVVPEEDTEIREAKSHRNEVIESTSGTIQAYWTTEPVKFNVSKTYKSTNVNLTGIEDGSVRLSNNLQWSIQSSHNPETTSYGKDRAKSMEYVDSITFPQGLDWKEEILAGIQAEDVTSQGNDIYVGEVRVATIARKSNQSGGGTLEWDGEKGKPVFRFNKLNSSKETEMSEDIVDLTVYTEAIAVDQQAFSATDEHIITNNVDETVHFQFSEDQKISASAANSIVPQDPAIKLTKESTTATFFGEDITYTLKLQNPGTREYKSNNPDTYVLRDVLDGDAKQVWIKPANMKKMFEEAEATGENLTITIKDATLAAWEKVAGKDGEETTSWQHAGNSDRADKVTGAVIAITKIGDKYQAVVTSGGTWNGTYTDFTVEALLQKIGYAVTKEAQYICDWALVEGKTELTLGGGETHIYHIYATAKDTFSMLSKDWPVEYEDSASPVVGNAARVVGVDANDKETNNIASASSQNINLKREAIIDKQLFTVSENEEENGKNITSRPSASDGNELKYTLTFTHY